MARRQGPAVTGAGLASWDGTLIARSRARRNFGRLPSLTVSLVLYLMSLPGFRLLAVA